ncbi:GAF domain-containing protein [Streptomyces sp. INA 01156]
MRCDGSAAGPRPVAHHGGRPGAVAGGGCGRASSCGRFSAGHPVMRTLLGVPLMVRGTVYGDLYVADKRDGTPFDDDDEGLLTALASAAGVSLENARLYEQLRRAAEHFQRRMLPYFPILRR